MECISESSGLGKSCCWNRKEKSVTTSPILFMLSAKIFVILKEGLTLPSLATLSLVMTPTYVFQSVSY